MTLAEILPIIIYCLVIVLLIILIILGVKLIQVVNKTDRIVEDVEKKINTFNPVFKLIDLTSSGLAGGITTLVESTISLINKIFKKKEDDDYE